MDILFESPTRALLNMKTGHLIIGVFNVDAGGDVTLIEPPLYENDSVGELLFGIGKDHLLVRNSDNTEILVQLSIPVSNVTYQESLVILNP